jgi:hypothetical protein
MTVRNILYCRFCLFIRGLTSIVTRDGVCRVCELEKQDWRTP